MKIEVLGCVCIIAEVCEDVKGNDSDGCGKSTLDPARFWAVPRAARLEVVVGPTLVLVVVAMIGVA